MLLVPDFCHREQNAVFLVLLVAPFAILPTTVALPAGVELGPGEDVQTTTNSSPVATSQSPLPSTTTSLGTSQTVTTTTSSTAPSTGTTVTVASGYRNALYLTNWGTYGANYQPQQLPGNKITHVLYAFADIASDARLIDDMGLNAYGCVKQLYLLKKRQRHFKTLLSIGGWTYSPKFAPVAATEAGRQRFWNSSATPLNRRPAAKKNNTMKLGEMDPLLDAWHIMVHDYAGSWGSTTGHQSNLRADPSNPQATKFSTERAITDYVARGIPAAKIVLGMPLYGRAFENTKGLGQPYASVEPGSIQAGVYLCEDLPRPGVKEIHDESAGANYSFDEAKGELVSYDNVFGAQKKAEYLVNKSLGGAVFWETVGDMTGNGSLVSALAGGMGRLETAENWLSYPESRYQNIKNGMPGA
ncbi:glycoside hydrolase family 18 protein [Parathielavia appendiculata]|uniref:chitinase n=1 Tax=Parathielavia appendiculata TaxID=2587402 RepID=A0AAN6UBU2_9PEZI|nr:glycoside hydrolase family 18 protein [Parathielavia appendiculata]